MSSALADRPLLDEAQAQPPTSIARLLTQGAAVAVWVCVAGFGVVAAPVLLAWLGGGAVEPLGDALSVAGTGWLLGMGATLSTLDGYWSLTPLGLTLVSLVLGYRGGLWVTEAATAGTGTRLAAALVSSALTAAALGGVVASAVTSTATSVDPGEAAAQSGLVVVTGAAIGALVVESQRRGDLLRLPGFVWAALRPALAGLAVMTAAAAALTTAAMIGSFATITSLLEQIDPGPAGLLALLALCLAYLPTLLVWALAVLLGPGVSLGSVVSVSATGVDAGSLPGFPLLGVVPQSVPGWLAPAGTATVLAAGLVAGLIAYRASGSRARWWEPPATAAAAAVLLAAVVAFASWAASGAMGPGDLSWVSVEAATVAAWVGMPATVAGVVTAGGLTWRSHRPSREESDSFSAS